MKKKYGQISSKISGNKAGFREKYFPENSPFFKEILIYPNIYSLHVTGGGEVSRFSTATTHNAAYTTCNMYVFVVP